MPFLEEETSEKKIEENLRLSHEIYKIARKNRQGIKALTFICIIQLIIIILIFLALWNSFLPNLKQFNKFYQKFKGTKSGQVLEEMKEGFPVKINK